MENQRAALSENQYEAKRLLEDIPWANIFQFLCSDDVALGINSMEKQSCSMQDTLPWADIFEFLCGKDVAKALFLVSKHESSCPWRMNSQDALGRNEQQEVIPFLFRRLESTERGRQMLRIPYFIGDIEERDHRNMELDLPKMIHCHEEDDFLRFDGVYRGCAKTSPTSSKRVYMRFYPNGCMLSTRVRADNNRPLSVEKKWLARKLRRKNFRGKHVHVASYEWYMHSRQEKFATSKIMLGEGSVAGILRFVDGRIQGTKLFLTFGRKLKPDKTVTIEFEFQQLQFANYKK